MPRSASPTLGTFATATIASVFHERGSANRPVATGYSAATVATKMSKGEDPDEPDHEDFDAADEKRQTQENVRKSGSR